jgi:hypothetical protein
MESRADESRRDVGTSKRSAVTSGSVRRTPTGGPTTDDGARYLEELRTQWRSRPDDGPRLFNPDETPAERDERIRGALAGLAALAEAGDEVPDESPEVWDQVMKAIEGPRVELREIDLDSSAP